MLITALFSFQLFPQSGSHETSKIDGKIIDVEGEPVPFANVVLFSQDGNRVINGTTTDFNGKFKLEAKEGTYQLKISFISFKEKTISPLELNKNIHLGDLTLLPAVTELEEVTILETRNIMELKLDKRVFNVASDLSNVGGNASEILGNVPSVNVDVEGNISLRGSENVKILINGKPSGLVGSQEDALKQLQGNLIERIEVITNPSARYDAEGEVGIINIILKKDERPGSNGSFELAVGYPETYQLSGNMSFNTKKANIFGGYGYRNSERNGGGKSFYEFSSPDTSYIYESSNERTRGGISHNFSLGTDYFIDTSSTLSANLMYAISDDENISELTYKDFDFDSRKPINTTKRIDNETETEDDIEAAISYEKVFKSDRQKLFIQTQLSKSDEVERSIITETDESAPLSLLEQKVTNAENSQNLLFQADYTHPFSENGLFETGVKATQRNIESDFLVEEKQSDASFKILDDFNNNFDFDESIYAAYLMAGNKIKSFSYQLGVRAELSDVTSKMESDREENNLENLDFFPSAHFSYELNPMNTLQFSYSRRISRPRHWHLLPFYSFTDNRSFFRGNPNLQAEFTNSYELGFLKYLGKGSILSSVYYRHTNDVVERVNIQDEEGFIQIIPINLATENSYGLELNGNYEFSKKLNMNANFNFYREMTEGEYEGRQLESDNYSWMSRISAKTTLPKNIQAQLSFRYLAPSNTTQGRRKSMVSSDVAFSKDVLKGKGTLVLSVRDVLNTRKRRSITETEFLYSESEFQWSSRSILLSFSYRINQKKSESRKSSAPIDSGGDEF